MHRRSPNICVAGRIHRPMLGKGMGSILLDKGGPGAGSSYRSLEEYEDTTGRGLASHSGHSHKLTDKLSKLMVKPLTRKPKNICFE
jgi:hypothetical protein